MSRSSEKWNPEVLGKAYVPHDEEDYEYLVSFTVDQEDEFKAFYEKYGFVVVRDVLTEEECAATVDEIYEILEQGSNFDRANVDTWDSWPKRGMKNVGMPTKDTVFTPQVVRNRQNAALYQVFSTLMRCDDILINQDRVGILRPTKNVPHNDGSYQDHGEWKTRTNVHLDLDPWTYYDQKEGRRSIEERLASIDYSGDSHAWISENGLVHTSMYEEQGFSGPMQGVINLCDNHEEDGGFLIVPTFRQHIDSYVQGTATSNERRRIQRNGKLSVRFDERDPISKAAIRVPMRAGSVVVWDQRGAHGSQANDSDRKRCAQFVKAFPRVSLSEEQLERRAEALRACLQRAKISEDSITDTGRKAFGLD